MQINARALLVKSVFTSKTASVSWIVTCKIAATAGKILKLVNSAMLAISWTVKVVPTAQCHCPTASGAQMPVLALPVTEVIRR